MRVSKNPRPFQWQFQCSTNLSCKQNLQCQNCSFWFLISLKLSLWGKTWQKFRKCPKQCTVLSFPYSQNSLSSIWKKLQAKVCFLSKKMFCHVCSIWLSNFTSIFSSTFHKLTKSYGNRMNLSTFTKHDQNGIQEKKV